MDQKILDYIKGQRVGVLAVEMLDGSPHAATVHYANSETPLVFYFETSKEYRKVEAVTGRNQSRASMVIGSNESDMRTLQMDGMVSLIASNEQQAFNEIYFGKFPEKLAKYEAGEFVLFKFTPTWWRFTDWTGTEGKVILTSI